MEKTKFLYDDMPYETSFSAEVLYCEELENGNYQVVLNQTLFFPEQGGQTPDKGVLAGQEVLDVQIKDDVIYHKLSKALPQETVAGQIDWAYRFSNMQQHTGEHIFSGIMHKKYGFDNVGFHLSDSVVTMDFNGTLTMEEVLMVQEEVNQVIYCNLPVKAWYPSKEEEAALSYRSKKELTGDIRLVEIPDIDLCACCAPHVKQTGEIGMLKVMSLQNYKGGIRISILCGKRALDAFNEKDAIVSGLMHQLSAGQEDLQQRVKQLMEEKQQLAYDLGLAKQELVWGRLQEEIVRRKDASLEAPVVLFETSMDAKDMRVVLNRFLKENEGTCGIFAGSNGDYHYMIASNQKDCREIATKLREKLSAKGGGQETMIQGSVTASEEQLMEAMKEA